MKNIVLTINLLAMVLVALLIVLGVRYALNLYTHHGEAIEVPSLRGVTMGEAVAQFDALGLFVAVSDTGYVKGEKAGVILDQTPDAGSRVKTGRTVYVVVNATRSPLITFPDIIDNSSVREATAKLKAMGFKVGSPEQVAGERDWVYGAKSDGRYLVAGDRVSVDATVTLQVGNGLAAGDDSISVIDEDNIGAEPYDNDIDLDDIDLDEYIEEL